MGRRSEGDQKDKSLPGVKYEGAGGGREIENHVGASDQPAYICYIFVCLFVCFHQNTSDQPA